MARAIWSGTISFGLLNVPVKMYSAVSRKTIRFNELRGSDGSRVRHKRVAEADDKEVDYDEIVKGYELSKDRYVVLTRDELAELDPQKTRAIEIQDFVDIDQIDPIYFDSPYYLAPAEGAEKAYSLLVKAMESSGKGKVLTVRTRQRGQTVEIQVIDDGPGIPAEMRSKIFDWFFTTKPPGEGTGLGLAVSRDILQAHGGNLRLEDTPGGGATFVLDLPRERPLS